MLTLRNRLVSGAREKGGKVMTRETVYAYTVYAWNAYAQERPLRNFSLQLDRNGLPEIDGLPRSLAAQLLD